MRRYEGAWDAIHHNGPDSVSQAAASLVELIKGALRESTSGDNIEAWIDSIGRPAWACDPKGFPTYRARAEFLLLKQGTPPRSAEACARSLTDVCKDLEEVKHGRTDASMQFVVSALLQFEAVLLASSQPDTPTP